MRAMIGIKYLIPIGLFWRKAGSGIEGIWNVGNFQGTAGTYSCFTAFSIGFAEFGSDWLPSFPVCCAISYFGCYSTIWAAYFY